MPQSLARNDGNLNLSYEVELGALDRTCCAEPAAECASSAWHARLTEPAALYSFGCKFKFQTKLVLHLSGKNTARTTLPASKHSVKTSQHLAKRTQ